MLDVLRAPTDEWRLISASLYPKLDYCIQYHETDFDFVSRLIEEFGIYYFFEHEDEAHDGADRRDGQAQEQAHQGTAISWRNAMQYSWTAITHWHVQEEARVGQDGADRVRLPGADDQDQGREARPRQRPPRLGEMEVVRAPARVVQNSVKEEAQAQPSADVKQRAKVRWKSCTALCGVCTGTTNVHGFHRRHDVQALEPIRRTTRTPNT